MEALNLTPVDYTTLIQEKLAFIPADYLAHLYQIVSLMARPFEPTPEPEPAPVVSEEELQAYTQEVRTGFQFYFSAEFRLNATYHIGEKLAYLAFKVVPTEAFEESVQASEQSIEAYIEANELDKEAINTSLSERQKSKLYEEDTFWIVRPNAPEYWTIETAKKDAREEIGAILQKLPSYDYAETE